LPQRSETIVATKTVFDDVNSLGAKPLVEYATIPREIAPGVYAARAIIPHKCMNIPVRVLNTSDQPVVLRRGSLAAELECVREEGGRHEGLTSTENTDWKQELLAGLDKEIREEDRMKIEEIITEFQDCFSQSEFDLGRTTLVTHQIETGDNAPVRQGLRR